MIGTVLGGRYELLELVGTGGMAHVYKARCNLLNRFVAVKILKDEFKNDKEFIKKFYIESQAAASLSNINIVSIYDVGEEEGLNYIVMEYVEGITLKDVIRKNGALEWKVALNCSLQILNALECAHKNGIVHRDIKPHNIIVTNDGILKVADFGIARAINGNETKKIDDSVVGSVHYISPEQAKGIMIDARSDIYSLGVVMYEMLTGKLPFEGENAVSVALMHLNSEPKPIKDINITVPLELTEIVHKAMKRDIAQRYQSAKEMTADLYNFKKREGVSFKDIKAEEQLGHTINRTRKANEEVKPVVSDVKKQDNSIKDNIGDDNMKKKNPKKTEKIAVYSAIGLSAIIIVFMVFVFMKIFFPDVSIGNLFKSKEFYLEDYVGQEGIGVKEKLEKEGIKVKIDDGYNEDEEDGVVLSQNPSGEMTIKVRGTTVTLVVNKLSEDDSTQKSEKITVLSFANQEYRQAKKKIEALGLTATIVEENADKIPEGYVIRQVPSSGKKVSKGSEIILYVSKGKNDNVVSVPKFIGMTEAEAKESARSLGLSLSVSQEETSTQSVGKIISQSIAAYGEVSKGTSVSVVVGKEKQAHTNTETPTQPQNPTPPPTNNVAPPTKPEPPVTQPQKNQEFTIDLPEGDSNSVVIKKDGKQVFSQTYQSGERRVKVPISGSGTSKIDITVNGQNYYTGNVNFN